uniref:Ig-like domain-containing protein n=2 Tax=Nannospalax galili TaxID=1026970 RepID=A0A8C6S3P3_NANGA
TEPLSAPPRTGSICWQRLLFTASLFTFWSSPTSAQATIDLVPPLVAEGKNVLLLVHNLPENLNIIYWYKGITTTDDYEIARYLLSTNESVEGLAHSRRETIFRNGSLLIENVKQNDTGVYTLQSLDSRGNKKDTSVQLYVHPLLSKPYITSNNSSPVEGEDSVALTCEPGTQNTTYLWWINGQSLSEGDRLELSEGNRTLTLLSVTRNDTGPYECETSNLVSANRSDAFYLNVTYGPDAPTISPPDSYFRSGTNLSLSCHATSNPPAQYSWLINEKPQPSSQELFIPNITTNHSGSYACLVYNSATGLNRTTVKNVTVLEPVSQPSIRVTNDTVKEKDSVVFTCVSGDSEISIQWIFNNQNLKLTDRMMLSENNSRLSIDPVEGEDAGEYQCEVSNLVSSKKSSSISLIVNTDPGQGSSGLSGGAIAGIVVGAGAGVALIAGLGYFLYSRKTGRGSDQHNLTEHTPSASNHSPGPSDNSPKKVDEVPYSVLDFNAQKPKQPAPASSASETVYSQVKKN